MEKLIVVVDSIHLLIVILMLVGLRVGFQPLKYPRLWKYVLTLWVVIPITQCAFGGRCPLTMLAYWMEGKPRYYPSFTQILLGVDIPWWATLMVGVAIAIATAVSMIRNRDKWILYQATIDEMEVKKKEATRKDNLQRKRNQQRKRRKKA